MRAIKVHIKLKPLGPFRDMEGDTESERERKLLVIETSNGAGKIKKAIRSKAKTPQDTEPEYNVCYWLPFYMFSF